MQDKIVTIFRTRQCKISRALVEELHKSFIDQEQLQVVYIQDQPDISTFYRIKASPTVLLFADTEETERHEGEVPASVILDFLAN
jgi:thioredoxin-like negative regulator of GroEL